jgi:murine toxin
MSKIDDVNAKVDGYFNHLSGPSYVRLLDTPRVWGLPFGTEIMDQAWARQEQFERAVVEIVQKARYRCDLSSLNSPDPDWARPILGAIDTALSTKMGRTAPTQFRFLFGQTPTSPLMEPANCFDFRGALIRLIRLRRQYWEQMPDIWVGRFYRLEEGILSALEAKVFGDSILDNDGTKMTWNHSKIVVADGAEALVGGHNLNMDLFRSYPPVHDVSAVVHGEAAFGAHGFLDRMWACGTDLFTKERLDVDKLEWVNGDADPSKPTDPLQDPTAAAYVRDRQVKLVQLHQAGVEDGAADVTPPAGNGDQPAGVRERDLQTLDDATAPVFPERVVYTRYDGFSEYRLATRMLTVGKYWSGPNLGRDYQKASELMKEELIRSAKRTIRMSQMDLVSAWKTKWSDHVVCIWLMDALRRNKDLVVQVVVSPLDAGAGAEGDQYSFGSGAQRTFDLMQYYMTHDVATDGPLDDSDGARAEALTRLHVAPFFFTDGVPADKTTEGATYKWPDLPKEGYTATLKQKPLSEKPPSKGIIGSAAMSVISASGYLFDKVPSAPGNHAKVMIVDDEAYVVGSDNLYPGSLSEINYLVEGDEAVKDLLATYWEPLWRYSGPHAVSG